MILEEKRSIDLKSVSNDNTYAKNGEIYLRLIYILKKLIFDSSGKILFLICSLTNEIVTEPIIELLWISSFSTVTI